MKVEILPLIGEMGTKTGPTKIQWSGIERLILNNREVAKIKTIPGAAITLFPHVTISEAEEHAIREAVAAARGGVPPEAIHATHQLYHVLVGGEDDELEGDGGDE